MFSPVRIMFANMNGAELFVRCLENEGVEYVFGLPGEEINELLKALATSQKIRFILSRHEQAASFMADVYGRLTGKAGVCLSTLGPGATNLLTGVADAYLDRAPLVAVTGQGGLARAYEESHQYIDVVSVYKFITKWNRSITRPEFIPQAVRKAFSLAESEKTGAVHLELPEDIASEEVSADTSPAAKTVEQVPSVVTEEGARRATRLIEEASLPIILAGNGVVRSDASKELLDFARELNIPVVNTFMGKGVVSARERLSIGTIGLQTRDLINCAFEHSDLVITVGYDFVEYAPVYWNGGKGSGHHPASTIIHIDSAASEVDSYYKPSLELIGNVGATLRLLVEESRRDKMGARRKEHEYCAQLKSTMESELTRYAEDNSFPVKPQKLIFELRRALSDDDIVISDVGMHKIWVSRLYPAYAPNTVIVSNGFASMGIALPGAIAAKLARPKKRTVAVCGDGGFVMGLYDLETARTLRLTLVVLVFDDGQYSQIDWKQRSKFSESYFVKFRNPDFVKLAESFGCRGVRVSSTEELREALSSALASKSEVLVIDVPVDTKENLALSERLGDKVLCPELR